MLEELAIQYLSMSENTMGLIGYGLAVVGAIIAAIFVRSKVEIAREAYFAYSTLILFLVSSVQAVWLLSIPATEGDYLWVLMAVSFAASIASGYFLCRLAKARSRDAYGNASSAFLAFIPILNFWLLFTRSKDEASTNRTPTIPLVSGGLGFVTGFVLLVATVGVNVYIDKQVRTIGNQTQIKPTPAAIKAGIEILLRSKGLEETLRFVAANAKTPITVDEVTMLARIVADGKQLRRTYLIDLERFQITEKFRDRIHDNICKWPAFQTILRAGGSIREVFVGRSLREIGAVMVTRDVCGF